MSAINVNSITGRTGTHGPVLTGVTTISGDLHVGSGLSVTGVSTFSNTVVGGATTELVVGGDARITGVLTVGQGSVTIGSTNITTQQINDLNYPTDGPLSNRNLIINGAMTVSQRYTSNTGQTATAYRACDRYQVGILDLGSWTISQSSNSPTGFSKSLRIECTTANASPGATAFIAVFYTIEAQDLQLLNYGSAYAKSMILSFYVRTNKTSSGTFAIRQRDNSDKLFSKAYNFNGTADTWKKVEIEIPADTAGVINDDNGQGLTLAWWLNSGSNYTGGGVTDGWEALDDTKRNATNAGIGGAVSDYFEITGVQLEVGTRATPFEHRSYGDELVKCMRYFQIIDGTVAGGALIFGNGAARAANNTHIQIPLGIALRDKPALSVTNTIRMTFGGSFADSSSNSSTIGGVTPSVHTDNTNFNVTLNYNGNVGVSVGTNQSGVAMMLNTPGTLRLDSEL